jgi:alkaline phosphatase D
LGGFAYFDSVTDTEGFRALWGRNLTAPGIADVVGRCASMFTWDDHEFDNNLDPETASTERMALARRAFFEHTPVRVDAPGRVWRALRLGKAVELFALDCRTERRRSVGEYLSSEQLAWLLDGVRASDATWKIVLNSVPAARLSGSIWDVPLAVDDRWDGFPEAKEALLRGLEGVSGVVFLSGDIHLPALATLEEEGTGARVWDIIAGPGGSSLNPGFLPLQDAPNVAWAGFAHNAVRVEASAEGWMDVWWIDEQGADLAYARLRVDGTLDRLETAS